MFPRPEFSIVIPTYNRAALIVQVVHALYTQTISTDGMEIIISDSMSSDTTQDVLKQLSETYSNLRFIRMDRPGAAAARNGGMDLAKGAWVVLLDDDILVPPNFLEKLRTAAAKYPKCVILGRIATAWKNSTDPLLRFLEQSQDVNSYLFSDHEKVPASHFYTACVALPSEVIQGLRFDEKFTGYGLEDTDFGIRLLANSQTRMVFVPELEVRHEYFPQYEAYRRKKYCVGKILSYFLSKSPEHAAAFYVEPTKQRWGYRFYTRLFAPFAWMMWRIESKRARQGPLSKFLYTWIQRDLRIQLYNGMRDAKK